MNLVSSGERAAYLSAFSNMQDTFSRNITVYRQSKQTLSSTNPNYDAFYDAKEPNITYTSTTGVFPARIKYIDKTDKEFGVLFRSEDLQVSFMQQKQVVRIKVEKDANDFIMGCQKVIVDGVNFYPSSSASAIGLFGQEYYTIYLKQMD